MQSKVIGVAVFVVGVLAVVYVSRKVKFISDFIYA